MTAEGMVIFDFSKFRGRTWKHENQVRVEMTWLVTRVIASPTTKNINKLSKWYHAQNYRVRVATIKIQVNGGSWMDLDDLIVDLHSKEIFAK